MSVFLIRKRFFRPMRKPSAEADWKSALRGDREVMFEDFGGRHMSGSGSELVRMMDCEHAAASLASSPRVTPIWNLQYDCSNLNRKLQSQKLAFEE